MLFIVVIGFVKSKKNTNGEEKRQTNHRGNYVNTLAGLDFVLFYTDSEVFASWGN